ncbi:PAP [Enterospora canceri]|uniref:Poly(A) polymerase n=1 Tax=Enterospora canceri TaxID=1081671 RepID=A0A1Y1S6D7_9MICR|nr:PAP [Enterospora canceri]
MLENKTENAKYGITGYVSLNKPSSDSVSKSTCLLEFLKKHDFFEGEEDLKKRERALGRLDHLLKKFVEEEGRRKGESGKSSGKIFTFGSYRLGVHDTGADIDLLCVVPRFVSRKEFFDLFYEILKQEEQTGEITKAEDAYVPVIKMEYMGIPIDLTMARVNLPRVDSSINLLNDKLLRNMDEKCILSLNGSRVTDAMLNLVPDCETFHMALRTIKFWAKRRYIYGNAYGYFGGVAYAISVARICQMYPNGSVYDVVCKYFETFSSWDWPAPVILTPVVDHQYNLKVWDAKKYPADKYHKMPVITPAYPSMCATHNISQSTADLITHEIQRAKDIASEADGDMKKFITIFNSTDFFRKYKLYVNVKIEADSENMKAWIGYVESKVRVLCNKLDTNSLIVATIPFPKAFIGETQCNFFAGISVLRTSNASKRVYVDEQIRSFTDVINGWAGKSGDMKIEVRSETKKGVQAFIKEYFDKK